MIYFPSSFGNYYGLFAEMEEIAVNWKFPPSEVKAMPVRERHNWLVAGRQKVRRMKQALDV